MSDLIVVGLRVPWAFLGPRAGSKKPPEPLWTVCACDAIYATLDGASRGYSRTHDSITGQLWNWQWSEGIASGELAPLPGWRARREHVVVLTTATLSPEQRAHYEAYAVERADVGFGIAWYVPVAHSVL